jgi:hypothetical protein
VVDVRHDAEVPDVGDLGSHEANGTGRTTGGQ